MPSIPLTLLTITPLYGAVGPEPTPYSIRGATQTLELITDNPLGSQIRRTVNGGLMDLTYDQFRKYKSLISGTDHEVPAFDGAKQGSIVQVDCCAELAYKTVGGSPNRPVVSGSSRVEGDFTFYRPSLTMMVINFRQEFAEWEARYQWALELQEV